MLQLTKMSLKMFDKFVLTNYSENGNKLLDIDKLINQLTTSITEFIGKRNNSNNTFNYYLGSIGAVLSFVDENQAYIGSITPALEKKTDAIIKTTLKKRFEQLKTKLEKSASVQDPNKPFGKILFGPQRSKPEPNTSTEQYIFNQIYNYTEGHLKSISAQTKNELADLLQNKQYTDILVKPKPGIHIFRGMLLRKSEILNIISEDELVNIQPSNKYTKKLQSPLVFKPKAQISSWSKEQRIARDFANRGTDDPELQYSIIMISKIKKEEQHNFFDLDKWYKEIGGLVNEEEVIALNEVEVFEIRYWRNIVPQ